MQDVGGCRAIVRNLDQLIQLKERLLKANLFIGLLKSMIILLPKTAAIVESTLHTVASSERGSISVAKNKDWDTVKNSIAACLGYQPWNNWYPWRYQAENFKWRASRMETIFLSSRMSCSARRKSLHSWWASCISVWRRA